jgi:hypothetical protein
MSRPLRTCDNEKLLPHLRRKEQEEGTMWSHLELELRKKGG